MQVLSEPAENNQGLKPELSKKPKILLEGSLREGFSHYMLFLTQDICSLEEDGKKVGRSFYFRREKNQIYIYGL